MAQDERHSDRIGHINCDHKDVVAKIHALDRELHIQRVRYKALAVECAALKSWVHLQEKKSSWFYDAEPDLRQIVDSKKWVSVTRHVIAWAIGALVAAAMFWNTVFPFLNSDITK